MSRGKVWSRTPQKKEDLIKALLNMPAGMNVVVCDGYEESLSPLVNVEVMNIENAGKASDV